MTGWEEVRGPGRRDHGLWRRSDGLLVRLLTTEHIELLWEDSPAAERHERTETRPGRRRQCGHLTLDRIEYALWRADRDCPCESPAL